MTQWETLIDQGADLCGSQNALARYLEESSSNLAQAKAGRRPLAASKLEKLATLLGVSPAVLWEAQELANMPRRNPFRSSATATLSAVGWTVMTAILSALFLPGNQALARASAEFSLSQQVIHCRASKGADDDAPGTRLPG